MCRGPLHRYAPVARRNPSANWASSSLAGGVGARRSNVMTPTLRLISGSLSGRVVNVWPLNILKVRAGRAVTPRPASTSAAAEGICSTVNAGSGLRSQCVKAASVRRRTDEVRASAMNGNGARSRQRTYLRRASGWSAPQTWCRPSLPSSWNFSSARSAGRMERARSATPSSTMSTARS